MEQFNTRDEEATVWRICENILSKYSSQGRWGSGFFLSIHADEGKGPNRLISTVPLCAEQRFYLRHPLWRDKAGGLDHRQACSWQHVYQLDFHPCWDNFLGNNESEMYSFWIWFHSWWEVQQAFLSPFDLGFCSRLQITSPFSTMAVQNVALYFQIYQNVQYFP